MMSQTPKSDEPRLPHTGTAPEAEAQAAPVVARPLAHCLRCGYQWFARVSQPAQCPHCHSTLWNTPRAQQLEGKPAPTRKGKRRGGSFTPESSARANAIKAGLSEEVPQDAHQSAREASDDS